MSFSHIFPIEHQIYLLSRKMPALPCPLCAERELLNQKSHPTALHHTLPFFLVIFTFGISPNYSHPIDCHCTSITPWKTAISDNAELKERVILLAMRRCEDRRVFWAYRSIRFVSSWHSPWINNLFGATGIRFPNCSCCLFCFYRSKLLSLLPPFQYRHRGFDQGYDRSPFITTVGNKSRKCLCSESYNNKQAVIANTCSYILWNSLFPHDRIQQCPDLTVKLSKGKITILWRKQYLLSLKQPIAHLKPNYKSKLPDVFPTVDILVQAYELCLKRLNLNILLTLNKQKVFFQVKKWHTSSQTFFFFKTATMYKVTFTEMPYNFHIFVYTTCFLQPIILQ